jgi:hypothetical protein
MNTYPLTFADGVRKIALPELTVENVDALQGVANNLLAVNTITLESAIATRNCLRLN